MLWEPLFLFHAALSHTFQDVELAVFKPFYQDVSGSIFEMPILLVFGGGG